MDASFDINERVRKNIKKHRLLKRKTLVEVADYVGVSEGTLSHWENGNRRISEKYYSKFCQLFGLPLDELLKDFTQSVEGGKPVVTDGIDAVRKLIHEPEQPTLLPTKICHNLSEILLDDSNVIWSNHILTKEQKMMIYNLIFTVASGWKA